MGWFSGLHAEHINPAVTDEQTERITTYVTGEEKTRPNMKQLREMAKSLKFKNPDKFNKGGLVPNWL